MAQLQIRDAHDNPIPLMNVRISMGVQPSDEAIFDIFTDLAGNSTWPLPFFPISKYAFHVNFANVQPEYVPQSYYIQETDLDNVYIKLDRVAPSRLHVEGHDFVNEFGQRTFIKGVTDFLLYKRFLDEGADAIRPILNQRSQLGANCVRVIGMVSSFSHWFPQDYGNQYYDGIVPFMGLLAEYGLYCYFTVFADTQIVMDKKIDQLNHWARLLPILQSCPNVIIELVNEPYAHSNATDDPWAFPRPWLVPASSGSYNDIYGGQPTPPPYWDFHDMHVPRVSTPNVEGKNVADQCMTTNPNYKLGMPVLSGEPDKFGRPDPNGKPRHTSPRLAAKMAGTARGTTCGVFYHTNAGIMSVPFDDTWNEIQCAEAWFRELK